MTETNPTPAARIKRIEVVGLFGLYDHVIDLNLEDRVTILHGPNGVGKTVLLKMIRAVLNKQFDKLAQIPFQRFRIDFTTGRSINLIAEISSPQASSPRGKRQRASKTLTDTAGADGFVGSYTARTIYPKAEIFENAGLPGALARQFPGTRWLPGAEDEDWSASIKGPHVHLIEDQRILRRLGETSSELHPAVWSDAIDLQGQIAGLARAYLDTAQALDQTFPTRLVQRSDQKLPLKDLKSRMSALESLRATLQNRGILNEPRAEPFNVASLDTLTAAQSDVMALYVEDNEKKLGIFATLLKRVELFLRIINDRFRNKRLRADHHRGLVVVDHDGQPLELRALSSGEQQQVVLVYALLFRVQPGTLVLLDEPELSWHLLWQKRFLPDLLEIVEITGIDALIATHSPSIVGDRSDLMVALDAEIDHDEPRPAQDAR